MNKAMTYQDSKPFDTRPRSAWILTIGRTKKLLLCSPDMKFEDVHEMCRARHKKFKLGQLDVGELTFTLGEGDYLYSSDSREYDENLESVSL